jgi:hypothetical protein
MTNGFISRLIPLAPAMFTNRGGYWGIDAGFPASNLADRQPKIVCQGNVAGGAGFIGISFDVDLGADTPFDTVAIVHANLSVAGGNWSVYGYTAAAGLPTYGTEAVAALLFGMTTAAPFGVAPTTRAARRHALITGTSTSRRYLRFYIGDTTVLSATGIVNAGVLCIGQSINPFFNYENASGWKIDDASPVRILPGGETFTQAHGKVPLWRCTWSSLTEAEMRDLRSLVGEIGTSEPLLIVEDPSATIGQSERIHYGLLTNIDFTERIQIDKQRLDLTIRELV